MPKFNVYFLVSTSVWGNIEAENEEEAINIASDDPLVFEYRKLCDEPYRLVAEKIEEDGVEGS